ncbi:MAG TPA: hypothetical protein VGP08_06545 [Pyrinomonadaceae bacterium]|jgi:hypothetical protein|nr:hypothetical protein [Pyrinomonadaceae bacterium]
MIRRVPRTLFALSLALVLAASALADTIRLKDGQVIRGQIVSFRDQQFTVLIGSGAGGRRSRVTVYIDDIDTIEFDSAAGVAGQADPPAGDPYTPPAESARAQTQTPPRSNTQRPPTLGNDGGTSNSGNTTPSNTNAGRTNTGASTSTQPSSGGVGPGPSAFFPVRVRVRADNTANGWTDSGLMVRKGQKLRISATGRVSLGEGRFSTPTGLPRVVDTEKLMRNEPTGELIAVIGDDNDEFIPVGANREFYAPRDGRLFLGVNEGKLEDNTGTYEAVIEVEPVAGGGGGR